MYKIEEIKLLERRNHKRRMIEFIATFEAKHVNDSR